MNYNIENLQPKPDFLLIQRISFLKEIQNTNIIIENLSLDEEYYGKQFIYGKVIKQGKNVKEDLIGKYIYYDRYNSKSFTDDINIYDFTEFRKEFVLFILEKE